MNTKVIPSMARPQRPIVPTVLRGTLAVLTALFVTACSGGDNLGPRRDSSAGQPYDSGSKDSVPSPDKPATDTPAGCLSNGQLYGVGQVYLVPGSCPAMCQCLAPGAPSCISNCTPDAASPDDRPATDTPLPVSCLYGGRSYAPGENVPYDTCGGVCVCMADGTLGHCVSKCVDAGPTTTVDAPRDRAEGGADRNDRDVPLDYPSDGPILSYDGAIDRTAVDRAGNDRGGDQAIDRATVDANCTVGSPCTLANGNKGICPAGTCKACAGAQDDNACVTAYGTGKLCADGQCVTGTCHDSKTCTGKKVCDTTHTCQSCASDQQCKNDTTYGNNTICLANGQCVTGTCHTSTDCQGKKLCDSTAHTCSNCTTDAKCQADSVYGSNSICVSSQCVTGACTTTADCTSWNRLCPTSGTNKICAPCTGNQQCKDDTTNYGSDYICVSGQCTSGACTDSSQCAHGRICTSQACVTCDNDTQCKNDAKYGQSSICLDGACTTGDCHDISADCSTGRICGASVPHACGDCTGDPQCVADARYGTGYFCVSNLCVRGDCHGTSSECAAGLVCGATTANTCGSCTNSDQCHKDPMYGTTTMCATTPGSNATGHCIGNACTNNHQACAANGSDICCNDACVTGSCCDDNDCATNPQYGSNYVCRQNSCTRCDSVTGNSYLVDPLIGDDDTGTGSGLSDGTANAACSFRTIKRALSAIGSSPAAGTTITIVGSTTDTASLYTGQGPEYETLPITIPANVTVTTKTGPIKLLIVGNNSGFMLAGDQAKLLPIAAAALSIDGAGHASDSGIVVAAGTGSASIANVTVVGTGGDGIQVTSGTLQIGEGVQVSDAGTNSARKSGLVVASGTVNIVVAESEVAALFENNTQSGILVTGTGVLNISGVNTSGGVHSVVAIGNANGNVALQPTLNTTAPTNVINGLYSYGSTAGDGLLIQAGSKVKVRNSVFQANAGNGIRIASGGSSSGANNLYTIDLGFDGDDGRNLLQTATANSPNGGAGLCVDLAGNTAAGELLAWGNKFVEVDCTATAPGAIRASTNCTGATDLGLIAPAATVYTDHCTH